MEKLTKTTTLRKILFVVYDINEKKRIIELINNFELQYACITHCFDKKEDGTDELKKEHIHFVVWSNIGKKFTLSRFVSELTPINLFEKCNNVKASIRYLTHVDYIEKYHYCFNDIESNLERNELRALYDNPWSFKTENNTKCNFNQIIKLIIDNELHSLDSAIKYLLSCNIDIKPSYISALKTYFDYCNLHRYDIVE